jgi:hypothetical protein
VSAGDIDHARQRLFVAELGNNSLSIVDRARVELILCSGKPAEMHHDTRVEEAINS